LRRLSGRLMKIQDEERRRVARELHDGLGQDLAAAKMLLDASIQVDTTWATEGRIADIVELIDRAIQQVRSVSHLLHPPLLDEVGLLSALRWYLDGITKRSSIETSLHVSPNEFPRLTPELETAVFRIVQEALTNVYRHSGARQAEVTLTCKGEVLKISVKDNGKGIEESTAELWPGGIGIGIGGMRQRAKELGGELRLANVHPGTLVEAIIPCTSAVAYRASAIG
jgi:two-component system, NarL family, sensor kinase